MNSPFHHDRRAGSLDGRGPPRIPVRHRAAGALPEHRTGAALQLLRQPDDFPAGREAEQALDPLDAHLLHVDQTPQTLQPLDVPGAVVPFPVPSGGLHQAVGFVQAKGLFRDTEEIGDDSDGEASPRVSVRFHQNRRRTACFGGPFHNLKPALYLRC